MRGHSIRNALARLLAAAGLARAAEVEHERRAAAAIRAAERERAGRAAAASAGKVQALQGKLRTAQDRAADEHAQRTTVLGLLSRYLLRLARTESEIAERLAAERRVKQVQLAIRARAFQRDGLSPAAAGRATQLASISPEYRSAVSRWEAGDVPAGIRHVRIANLKWSALADDACEGASSQQVLQGRLPFDMFSTVRQFAVGGVMLDIGADVGATAIPRVILGDFAEAYAAEPNLDRYRCLVGNTLDIGLAGRVLPDRIAITGSGRTVRLRRSDGGQTEEVPSLTLDAWIDRLGIAADEVRFVRIAIEEWNRDVLTGAAHLLNGRHAVWQIEMRPAVLDAADGAIDDLYREVMTHFTHIGVLGRSWSGQWRPASDLRAVFAAAAAERRPVSLLLLDLQTGRKRGTDAARPASTHQPSDRVPTISLLHATARLPDGWRAAMQAFLAKATDPTHVEYILAVNEDETFVLPSKELTGWGRCALVKEGVTGPASGWNAAARASRGDILITVADDYFPQDAWDAQIRDAIPDVTRDVVLQVNNSDGSGKLLPFSILTRRYYERYGYIFYPAYHGLFGDSEFTAQARRDRVVYAARQIVFEHRHPDLGRAPMDEVYARQKSHFAAGKRLFKERKAKGFPKWPA